MFRLLLGAACLLLAGAAHAADQLQYAPPPAWVTATPVPNTTPSTGAAAQVLLQDSQARYGPDGDEFYAETAIKVLSAQALNEAGNISVVWSPDTDTMTLHYLHIIRDGHVIDALAGGKKFAVLRRETNLELSMLDGSLTANIQLEDLRVGDVIDMAVTKLRRDPVYQGRSEGRVRMLRPGIVGRVHVRELWATSKPMRWQATDDLGKPDLARHGEQSELSIDLSNVEAPKAPSQAPLRFSRLGELEVSEFHDWAEVSGLMAPLYRKASTLAPDSPLRAQIERIRAASADPKLRAEMALRLVQDDVRYVALLLNLGGYTPATADLTWSRRFGDCKAKTALLLALLNGLGIEAQPALVNTAAGDALSDQLPILGSFDHVIVRASIGGKIYWLDGARLGDRRLEDIRTPDFHWALPVQLAGARLEKLEPPPIDEPDSEVIARLDATAGLDAAAPAHVEFVYRADAAVRMHMGLATMNKTDVDRYLHEMWAKQYPWITATTVGSQYDEDRRILRLTVDGAAKMEWIPSGRYRLFQMEESNLGWDASFRREPGPHLDAPFRVDYPAYTRWLVTVMLPQHGAGSTIGNAPDVDRVIAGVAYHRVSRIQDGVATMEASTRSLTPEFPASEAEAAAAALRELKRFDVQIIYSRPFVEDVQTTPVDEPSAPAPTDAVGFSQRGLAALLRRDYAKAVADLTQAIRLDPASSSHLYNRGVAYAESGHPDVAIADFTAALRLKPSDVLALLARAQSLLLAGQEQRASADFDAALKLAPANYQALLRRAEAYRRAGHSDRAVEFYGELIAQFPSNDSAAAYSGLCRSRLALGRDLDQALSDCDQAVRAKPTDLAVLRARAEIHLRLGRYEQAIADYDRILSLDPSNGAAFCSRGAAKLAKGLRAQGQADIASGGTACKGTALMATGGSRG